MERIEEGTTPQEHFTQEILAYMLGGAAAGSAFAAATAGVQETTYKYVGSGSGEFAYLKAKSTGKLWLFISGIIGLLLLILILVLLLNSGPTTTTTPNPTLPYDCNEGLFSSEQWSVAKKDYCCEKEDKGCAKKTCTMWGDPHIISFDQVGDIKGEALSFYGDGDFWVVKSPAVSIQGRFEGTKYTEGLAATNQIVVSGTFLNGHKIEVGTKKSGIVTVDGQAVFTSFPAVAPYKAADGSFTVAYDALGEVPDVVPEGNEKRIVRMELPQGITVNVFQWFNYLDVTITMAAQAGQDGVCGNFNGDHADDTTQTVMERIGARVKPSENVLSGQAKIEFTPQMEKMMAAECAHEKRAAGQAECAKLLGAVPHNEVQSCTFDMCFGMNVRARRQAKTYH